MSDGLSTFGGVASFIATPGAYAPLGGIKSFSRADATTCATQTSSGALIAPVAANVLRDAHYVYSTSGGGLVRTILLEPSRVALACQSTFAATWAPVNAVLTPATATGPDGGTTAASLVDNSTNGQHRIDLTSAFASGAATLSVFGKYVSGTILWSQLRIGLVPTGASFNLQTGAVANAPDSGTSAAQPLGNGWSRFWISNTAAGSDVCRINLNRDAAGTSIYAGTGQGLLHWGVMLEQAAFPTTYIATAGAAETRAVDALVLNGAPVTGTLFYHYYDESTGAWADAVSAYTANTNITPTTGKAYSTIAVVPSNGTLTAAQCKARIGGTFPT